VKAEKEYWQKFVQILFQPIFGRFYLRHVEMHVCLYMKSVILVWSYPKVGYIEKI